ncbi:MAG TPA: CDGSH iron-sulfur domain-containing protein [Gammaproteobacteria bacterium]
MSMYERGQPYPVEVKAGEKVWICRCGKTGKPPFCDGTHKTVTGVTPLAHAADKDGKVYVCGCGRSSKLPFCDGTHKSA